MKVYRSVADLKGYKDSGVTVGNFDGVHRGHLEIIERLVDQTRRYKCRSVLITFHPHPQEVKTGKHEPFALLTPLEEKIKLLRNTGIDILLIFPFNQELSRMKAEDFIIQILKEKVGAKYIIIGFDHSFGRQRSGDVNLLRQLSEKYDFSVDLVEPFTVEEIIVSSSKIRDLLMKGDIVLANKMLGRNYSLVGKVVRGKKIGKKIGFPTANISVDNSNKLVPGNGVYAVAVSDGQQKREATVYIGKSPTVQGTKRMIEIYLHDFSGDLYGYHLGIEFLDYIRQEKKFSSIQELKNNIENDINRSKNILSLSRRK